MMDPDGFFIHVDDGWPCCRAGSSTAASSRIWSAPS
jgi:hypothetical protein